MQSLTLMTFIASKKIVTVRFFDVARRTDNATLIITETHYVG